MCRIFLLHALERAGSETPSSPAPLVPCTDSRPIHHLLQPVNGDNGNLFALCTG
jgi:hypothetical protein